MNGQEASADGRAGGSVSARLAELVAIETWIVDAVGASGTVVGDRGEAAQTIAAVGSAAAARRKAVEDRIAILGASGPAAIEPTSRRGSPASASEALRQVACLALEAAFGYEAAYLSARLGYDGDTCDILEIQLADCVAGLAMVRRALPHVVAAGLADVGTVCACRCPGCSIGLCGCLRATLVVTELGWTGQEPAPTRGLLLQTRPRPGSQLAEAGLSAGDRILTVDGDPVGVNADVQAALRRREVGQEARLEVERRSGERIDIMVRRVA